MKTALVAITALALLALASGAQAAQRYASPTGGETGCTQIDPCSLAKAVAGAKENDEVIVGSGIYPLAKPLVLPDGAPGVYLHGDFSGPMPLLVASIDEVALVTTGTAKNDRIAWLEITVAGSESSALTCDHGGSVDRVRATASGVFGTGITLVRDCAVSNSLALSSGQFGSGLVGVGDGSSSGTVRNVTAIATGLDSKGIVAAAVYESFSTYRLDVSNAIASGVRADLLAGGAFGERGELVASYSSFETAVGEDDGTVVAGGGNQTAPPLFVNAAGGDYREAAGSPTIDAGLVGPGIGSLDLAGSPRVLGGSVDIGAYEFVPPPPPAVAPVQVQSLTVSPTAFKPANLGEAIVSARKKGRKAPVATTVKYSLSAASTTVFTVERKTVGRKAGKKCVKQTKANKGKRKCALLKPVKGSFTHSGAAGANAFKFSGRVGGKALGRGGYVLTAAVGSSTKTAPFKIVK